MKSFGQLPTGSRLARIEKSPNYKEGSFQNLERTIMLSPDASYPKLIAGFFFGKGVDKAPTSPLTTIKTDLKSLSPNKSGLIWFGHSSYLITIGGKFILVDPVFSQRASPFQSMGTPAFPMQHTYDIDDFPSIDLVILTHDHYDHLDYPAISRIHSRVNQFAVSLGVGAHLEYWGVDPKKVKELDWWESDEVMPGFELTAAPARHFSGRVFKRGQSLWSSFILKVEGFKVLIGGDSGYDRTFKNVGEKFGPFDLAILECGQYDKQWPQIHMMPEETVQAAIDVKAKMLLPVHWGKFKLANHAWYEPAERAVAHAMRKNQPIITPRIGQLVSLDNLVQLEPWWQ